MTDGKEDLMKDILDLTHEAMAFANIGIYRYRPDGTLVFLDRGTLKLLDLQEKYDDPAELIGTDIGDLFEYVLPRGSLRREVADKGRVRQLEYNYKTLSGEDRWVYHNSFRVADPETGEELFQVVAQDITPVRKAMAALEATEERYRALAEQATQAILVVGFDGKVIFSNSAFARITFRQDENFEGAKIERMLEGVHPEDRELVSAQFARRSTGENAPTGYDIRMIRNDGVLRWLRVNASTIELQGRRAVQIMMSDVTEVKIQREREKAREAKVLHAQKLESLGVMAGGIAHDFNNLLTAIVANADLARRVLHQPVQVEERLDMLIHAADQAAQLCQQLLAYAGRGQLRRRPVDLNALVSRSVDLIGVSLQGRGSLTLKLCEDLPRVKGDPTQLQQIVLNLVANAGEALPNGVGKIIIRSGLKDCSRVELDVMDNGSELSQGSYVFLTVEDDGKGMDETTAAQIFDPFFTTKFTGRGLGLASVLGIIKGHCGAIGVETSQGEGTLFTILLPASEDGDVDQKPTDEGAERWTGSGLVLVADDEQIVLGTLTRLLQDFGFDVLQAQDGVEAVEIFESRAEDVKLVILDVTMPRMGGLEACRHMRAARPDVPVLFSSGYNEQELSKELSSVQATGFLRKPYRMIHLEKLLKKLV